MFGFPLFPDWFGESPAPRAAIVRPIREDSFTFDGVLYRLKEDKAVLPRKKADAILPSKPVMSFTQAIYAQIMEELTSRKPEAGGLLVGPKDGELVTHFLFDHHGHATSVSFTLDHAGLNAELKKYVACDLDVKGIVHSHPSRICTPSRGDLVYVSQLWSNPKNDSTPHFLFPIVCDKHLYPYFIVREANDVVAVEQAQLLLV